MAQTVDPQEQVASPNNGQLHRRIFYDSPELSEFSYHHLRYVDEVVEDLQCPICYEIIVNPVTTPCEHTFCANCLSSAIDRQHQQYGTSDCPSCRTHIEARPEDWFNGTAAYKRGDIQKRLDRLRAYCPNEGCTAILERYLIESHIRDSCLYQMVPCFDPECEDGVQRHNQRWSCVHKTAKCRSCGTETQKFKLQDHEDICPGLERTCSVCKVPVPRSEFSDHMETLHPEPLRCPGQEYGCPFESEVLSEMDEHVTKCPVPRLGRIIKQQQELLDAHGEALYALVQGNTKGESKELQAREKTARSEAEYARRITDLEEQTTNYQAQLSERLGLSEMRAVNQVQEQQYFNNYIEACVTRMQSNLDGMFREFMRGRMFPPPLVKAGLPTERPGSEGSSSVAGQGSEQGGLSIDDAVSIAASGPSARDQLSSQDTSAFPPFAIPPPNASGTSEGLATSRTAPFQPAHAPRISQMPRRRSSEERSIKL